MEDNGEIRKSGSFRKGSFRGLGLGTRDHCVIEIGSIDKQRLLLAAERERQQAAPRPKNSLTRREMLTLTALCDAFLPSLNDVAAEISDESVAKFYRTSASMVGTPERLGGFISERLKHPKTWLLRLTLWLLSTWFGTFILCGIACLSTKFPFFHSFPDLSLQKRQQIIKSWSLSFFHLLRMFFKTVKLLTLLVFFTQLYGEYKWTSASAAIAHLHLFTAIFIYNEGTVSPSTLIHHKGVMLDEAEDNPSWKAIGYIGPDPDFKSQLKKQFLNGKSINGGQEQKQDDDTEEVIGPLYKGLVYLNFPRDITADALRKSGFSIVRRKSKAYNISNPSPVIQCDAVVVGSGSGGGLVAGVLAKAGYKVLVLEKGHYSSRNNLSLLEGPTMEQMYLNNGLIATDDMSVFILAGSTVGGGSTINWSASIETPPHVCKEWTNRLGLELFESKLYKEAILAVCEKMGVQSEIEDEGFNNAILRRGCQEMGYPVKNIPRNSPPNHYCGWCCMGCKDGKKRGTAETWLLDLVKSGNGVILPGCEAIKVLHKKKKGMSRRIARGVAFEFEYNGAKEIYVVESKVTIVAGGAICTPPLLKRSGLKNKNIGKNLHLHPVTMAWGYFPDTPSSETWPEEYKKSYEGGILTAMSTVVAKHDKSDYGAMIQTPALHPGMFSILMPWISGTDIKDRMRRFSRTAHIFSLARDKGSGTVHSLTNISYKMEESDEENIQKGLEKILRILAAAGAEEIGTHHHGGRTLNVKKVSYHEFERFVEEESSRPLRDMSIPLCSAHQMGSCRMGNNPKDSVVNQMGETWEVEGLYLADSSVFPTALGVNPMVTVQAIAYCTAQSVLEVLKRKKTMSKIT